MIETLFHSCAFSFDEWIGVLLEIGSLSLDRFWELCSVTFHLLKTWPLLFVGLIGVLFEVRLEIGTFSFAEWIGDLLEVRSLSSNRLLEMCTLSFEEKVEDLLKLVIGDLLEFGSSSFDELSIHKSGCFVKM